MNISDIDKKLDIIRPFLQVDDGDVEIVELTDDLTLKIRLLGSCQLCNKKQDTIKLGIENTLKQFFPTLKSVEEVI